MRGKFHVPFYHPLPKSLHVVLQFVSSAQKVRSGSPHPSVLSQAIPWLWAAAFPRERISLALLPPRATF